MAGIAAIPGMAGGPGGPPAPATGTIAEIEARIVTEAAALADAKTRKAAIPVGEDTSAIDTAIRQAEEKIKILKREKVKLEKLTTDDKSKETTVSLQKEVSELRKLIDSITKGNIDPYKDKLEKLTKNLELEGKTKSIGSLATKGIESVDPVKIKDTLEKAKSGHHMDVSKLQDIYTDVKKAAANETLKKKIKDEYAKIIAKLG